MLRILVTDPEQRSALAAVRAVHARGWQAYTVGESRGLAGVSRCVRGHLRLTGDDRLTSAHYREAIARAAAQCVADAVFPMTDFSSRALLGEDARIGCRVLGPSRDAYLRASDKELCMARAATVGIHTPRTWLLHEPAQLTALAVELRLPVVVKSTRSIVEVQGALQKTGVRHVATLDELRLVLTELPASEFPLMIQQRIVGDGVGVFLYRIDGKTRLAFAHRRIREKPPSGGVSTARESIAMPAAMRERGEALLDQLAYDGPAMIELKREAATGDLYLMEINARLWGSLQLAVDAGADFVAAMVAQGLSVESPVSTTYQVGVRTVWELGELDHVLALVRRSAEQLHLPPGAHAGVRPALRALLDRRWGDRSEVFRFSDPMPFLNEIARWLRGVG